MDGSMTVMLRSIVLAFCLGGLLACSGGGNEGPDGPGDGAGGAGGGSGNGAAGSGDNKALGDADDGLGFGSRYRYFLDDIGEITAQELLLRYAPDDSLYQAQLDWDVTQADFWDAINSPVSDTPTLIGGDSWPEVDLYDFSLNDEELSRIRRQGFVVSEGLQADNFLDIYYRVFYRDLPVFITVDSVLHAWHRSYDALLEELERYYLSPAIQTVLAELVSTMQQRDLAGYSPVVQQAFHDLDLYFSVARSLFAGEQRDPVLPDSDAEASAAIVAALLAAQGQREFALFSDPARSVDTTQYTPRGHYTASPELERYFRGMMWLGRLDLRLASTETRSASLYELAAALVLNDLLDDSAQLPLVRELDELLQFMVGRIDALSLQQWSELLQYFSAADLKRYGSLEDLQQLQSEIYQSGLGRSEIMSRESLYNTELQGSDDLPVALPFFGQRFSVDAWATAMVTEDPDRLKWHEMPLPRKLPSDLDVAFSVLANDSVVPELVRRIEADDGLAHRDGFNYQPHLAAVRETVKLLNDNFWQGDLYNHWLYTLRALSEPTTGSEYPQAMRSQAWAQKNLQTQLASWSELRHDTLLYVKQPVVTGGLCYYPEGYVEPRLAFWQRMAAMARLMAARLETLDSEILVANTPAMTSMEQLQLQSWQTPEFAMFDDGSLRRIAWGTATPFFYHFADTMDALGEIARKQLASEALDDTDRWYLENIVEIVQYYNGPRTLNGWYPDLFYKGDVDAESYDALIADVQTALPDQLSGYPGNIQYQATGKVNLLAIAIENEGDKLVYLGPVFSHYELNQPYVNGRMDDDAWKQLLASPDAPAHPEASASYLVPGPPRGQVRYVGP